MKFDPLAAWQSVGLALKGWLGVFIVIAVIYALIVILNAVTGKRTKKAEK